MLADSYTRLLLSLGDSRHSILSRVLSGAALVVYVLGSILFNVTTFSSTFPEVGEWHLRNAFESLLLALVVGSLACSRNRIPTKLFLLAVPSVVILGFSAFLTENSSILFGYLVLFAIVCSGSRNAIRIYYFTAIATFVAVLVAGSVGLLYVKDRLLDGRIILPCGILHPNDAGAILLSALGAMAYDLWERRLWALPLILCLVAAAFCYGTLASDASFIVLIALCAVIAIGHSKLAKRLCPRVSMRSTRVVLLLVPAVMLACALFVTLFFDENSGFFASLSKALHHRPYYSYLYYQTNGGFTIWGRPYAYISGYRNGLPFSNLDCAYSHLAMVYGLGTLFVCALNYAASVIWIRNSKRKLLLVPFLVIMASYALMEVFPIYLFANSGMLMIAPLLRPIPRRLAC